MRSSIRWAALLVLITAPAAAAAAAPAYPPLPEAFSSFGAAVADGHVYVYGGHTGTTHTYSTASVTGKFRRLNLARPELGWGELPGQLGLQGLALVAHQGKLIRVGGMQPRNAPGSKADNVSVASCAAFDPKTKQWTALPDLPAGRSSHDAVVVGDALIVVGGWQMKGQGEKSVWHDTALLLDLAKPDAQWEAVPQPFERRALQLAALGGKVYVICGMNSENEMEKEVTVFDPASKRWTCLASLPGPIMNGFTPAAAVLGDALHVSPADGKLYRLNAKQDAWDEVDKLATKRIVHRMVPAAADLLLVLGGATKGGNVAACEAIEPSCCALPGAKTPAAPGTQTLCPIMTQVTVEAESKEVEYQGVKIKLCCSTCVRKWNADPEAYLDVALLPQLKGVALPKRALAQVNCPVYTDRVVSAQDPSAEYKGKTIYFFNQSARKRFLANPEQYANPKVLPQLAGAQ